LLNEDINNFYAFPNMTTSTKSRITKWAEHVARMEKKTEAYRCLVREPEGKEPWEDVDVCLRILRRVILDSFCPK
jgi:hypothetical protein